MVGGKNVEEQLNEVSVDPVKQEGFGNDSARGSSASSVDSSSEHGQSGWVTGSSSADKSGRDAHDVKQQIDFNRFSARKRRYILNQLVQMRLTPTDVELMYDSEKDQVIIALITPTDKSAEQNAGCFGRCINVCGKALPKGYKGWIYFTFNSVYSFIASGMFAALSYEAKGWAGGYLGMSASFTLNLPMAYSFTDQLVATIKQLGDCDLKYLACFAFGCLAFSALTTTASISLAYDAINNLEFTKDLADGWKYTLVAMSAFNTFSTRGVGATRFLESIFCGIKATTQRAKAVEHIINDLKDLPNFRYTTSTDIDGAIAFLKAFYGHYTNPASMPTVFRRNTKVLSTYLMTAVTIAACLFTSPLFWEKSQDGAADIWQGFDNDYFSFVCMLASQFFYLRQAIKFPDLFWAEVSATGHAFKKHFVTASTCMTAALATTFSVFRVLSYMGLTALGTISGAGMMREMNSVTHDLQGNSTELSSSGAAFTLSHLEGVFGVDFLAYAAMLGAGFVVNQSAFWFWLRNVFEPVQLMCNDTKMPAQAIEAYWHSGAAGELKAWFENISTNASEHKATCPLGTGAVPLANSALEKGKQFEDDIDDRFSDVAKQVHTTKNSRDVIVTLSKLIRSGQGEKINTIADAVSHHRNASRVTDHVKDCVGFFHRRRNTIVKSGVAEDAPLLP